MIVTHNGRLIHTLKLPYNPLEVTNLEHDPLRHTPQLRDGSQWSRDVRWQEEGRYRSAHLTSRFSLSGTENLTLAGNTLRCQVWREAVQADGLDRRWHNTFWIDSATGRTPERTDARRGRIPCRHDDVEARPMNRLRKWLPA